MSENAKYPQKCPKCGAEMFTAGCVYECDSFFAADGSFHEGALCLSRQLAQQRDRAEKAEAAHIRLSYEVEQTLGKALGYPELYPHASKVDDGTVCVGEHVPESILDEAANALAAKDARIAELEKTPNIFAKTEDGVTIVPDMLIWSIDFEGHRRTYSTREAAEAALAKGKLPCNQCITGLQCVGKCGFEVPMTEVLSQLAAAEARIVELEAIVGRLPKTGDGVVITPGMTIYQLPGLIAGKNLPAREVTPVLIGPLSNDDATRDLLGEVEEYMWTFHAADCYSTSKAAEAALAKAEK